MLLVLGNITFIIRVGKCSIFIFRKNLCQIGIIFFLKYLLNFISEAIKVWGYPTPTPFRFLFVWRLLIIYLIYLIDKGLFISSIFSWTKFGPLYLSRNLFITCKLLSTSTIVIIFFYYPINVCKVNVLFLFLILEIMSSLFFKKILV